jgi:hypothetical protein
VNPEQRRAEGARLEEESELVEVCRLDERERGDARAPLRRELDEPVAAEALERFAQRRRAHGPSLRKVLDDELRARRQLAGEDRRLQSLMGPVGPGAGCVIRHRRRTVADGACVGNNL